ncbi:NAD(P)-binding protein [Aspergillus sclerotioniger CBS 115572]|uniref:NAD(P)-binding protein n=1 Tax=Aspergillus sclerotioniger CBS 115572 TaxID=1450535 RepID=A0A317X4A1_9EURO|nr:NAD(P)-binding protein [Aspergillus sclerotioniger CBS 115572]PWY91778.1 NAD(P)-binding protein [Aspergillus sclerotioniger CBS 115572]
MAIPSTTRQWILNSKPTSTPILPENLPPPSASASASQPEPTFIPAINPLPPLTSTTALVQTLYISNDPAQRGQMSAIIDPARLYVPPMTLHAPVRTYTISRVLESGNLSLLAPGAIVRATTSWSEYAVVRISDVEVLDPEKTPGVRISHYMGSFGFPGITALYALKEIVKLKKGERIVVSGAAGAVGGMVVQIAKKVLGAAEVIGIAGTDDKCLWVEGLGADVCLNYKKEGFDQELWKATEGFVDVYFDNVGGHILDLMVLRVKWFGRIAACCHQSHFRTRVHLDYKDHFQEAREELIQAWKNGKIVVDDATETVIEATFEDIPKVWMKLFDGSNTGKLTTKLIG